MLDIIERGTLRQSAELVKNRKGVDVHLDVLFYAVLAFSRIPSLVVKHDVLASWRSLHAVNVSGNRAAVEGERKFHFSIDNLVFVALIPHEVRLEHLLRLSLILGFLLPCRIGC